MSTRLILVTSDKFTDWNDNARELNAATVGNDTVMAQIKARKMASRKMDR